MQHLTLGLESRCVAFNLEPRMNCFCQRIFLVAYVSDKKELEVKFRWSGDVWGSRNPDTGLWNGIVLQVLVQNLHKNEK